MDKLKLFRMLLFSFLFACLTNCLYSQTVNDSLAVKVDSIFQRFNSKSKPGTAVAIIENGKVAFEKCYGMANLEYDIPLTSQSVFDIASLSKQFTGFAISTLIEEEKINLNDDIRKYLPQVPFFGKPITIRHLLYHTSGLRDWSGALQIAGWRYTELASFNDVMKMVSKQKELDFESGTQYSYCNLGYNILAAIVEKVSGHTFKNWTKVNIFSKLGMNSSSFWDDDSKLTKNMAYSYYLDNGEYGNYPNVNSAYGSSTLRTTLDDLTKWVIFFQNALLSKNPVIIRTIQNGTLDNGDPLNYGFGLEVRYKNTDPAIIFHTGAWAGYRTIIKNHINDKTSFIVLSNADDNYAIESASLLTNLFVKTDNENLTKSNAAKINADPKLLKKYTGLYEWGGGELNVTIENEKLFLQYTGEPKFPLTTINDSSFLLAIADKVITFKQTSNGTVDKLMFQSVEGNKIKKGIIKHSPLSDYSGIYLSEELSAEYKVDILNNKLFIHNFRRGDYELTTSNSINDLFTSDIGRFQFYRNTNGKIIGFKLTGQSNRNIRFNKVKVTLIK